jgi:endonuclease/exonuclease/phosphatase family metal-dependent hydrolase
MMTRFTAVTYNVLAEAYAHRDRYPASPVEALDPARRGALMQARIRDLGADLLCLQELEPAVFAALQAHFAATHRSAYVQRTGRPEGVAIFARSTCFTWLGHEELRYRAHRPGDHDLALIAELAIAGRPLRVACTHLTWQPDSTTREDHVGYHQMLELLAHRDTAPADTAWIFAGDFNAISQSIVLAAALERGMDESCRTQRPWDTCAINRRPRKLDYLLFSTGRFTPFPGELPRLTRDSALPSATEPSDHLPLRVDFELRHDIGG